MADDVGYAAYEVVSNGNLRAFHLVMTWVVGRLLSLATGTVDCQMHL